MLLHTEASYLYELRMPDMIDSTCPEYKFNPLDPNLPLEDQIKAYLDNSDPKKGDNYGLNDGHRRREPTKKKRVK